ncbi:GTP 3',8-cyclase MoaA [Melioribacter sp. OK-6-Me]|uniref:GTP 3',8-cyclase MoaA n=1 Tax=unclassified Melioribacter TaxID=2627329 RepID=UPI003ED95C91
MKLIDNFNRIHDYVRISLIDKCNLNCIYCNPSNMLAKYESNKSILSYEELFRLIQILLRDLEVNKIRFTGGEPLIRKNVLRLFEMISSLQNKYNFEIGITTNGTQLLNKIDLLHQYGVQLLNISLDTLNKTKFIAITGKDFFDETLYSIQRAVEIGFKSVKVNMVVIKNINDDELNDFIEFFKPYPITVRFIEYMPFYGNHWDISKFLSWKEMKEEIEKKFSLTEIVSNEKVSRDFVVENTKLKVGFISSISNHFCDACNRLRITASGQIKNCLFSEPSKIGLKSLLADHSVADETIVKFIQNSMQSKWQKHPDADELSQLQQNNMMRIGG